jgi:hypothetical protein
MNRQENVNRIRDLYINKKLILPEAAGVYALGWIGDKSELLNSNRSLILSGPNKKPVEITLDDWWPKELLYPFLYIGKSTNIKDRFSVHLKMGSKQRLHIIEENGMKVKPMTTSCQLRYGIEHIFRLNGNPLELILEKVGFSFKTVFNGNNQTVERFYEEDFLIGKWRPWFNLDSER